MFVLEANSLTQEQKSDYFNNMPWLLDITDDLNDIKDSDSVVIDMSECREYSASEYIKKLIVINEELQKGNKRNMPICIFDIDAWAANTKYSLYDARSNTPIAALYAMMKNKPSEFKKLFKNYVFIFVSKNDGYFKLTVNDYDAVKYMAPFTRLLDAMTITARHDSRVMSSNLLGDGKVLTAKDIEKKKKAAAVISGTAKKPNPVKAVKAKDEDVHLQDELKEDLKKHIADAEVIADDPSNEEEIMALLDDDEEAKKIVQELSDDSDGNINLNKARSSRLTKINDEFMDKKMGEKTFKEILEEEPVKDLPSTNIKVDSINPEWEDMKFVNFEKVYDLDTDIVKMLNAFKDKTYPVAVRNITVEDTSNSQDYVDTYTVECEDGFGKRFTLKFDVPQFVNNRFMRLRGNDKVIGGQLLLLPCLKTEEDTVQIVSNYNKIFVRRYGFAGKSLASCDRLVKSLNKIDNSYGIKVVYGDNNKICTKYELPIDYTDIAATITRIDTPEFTLIFDQDYLRANCDIDLKKGLPFGIDKATGDVLYYTGDYSETFSSLIVEYLINVSPKFLTLYNSVKAANRLSYSKASIMANEIPVVVLLAYQLGLNKAMKDAMIEFKFMDKKVIGPKQDYIKFKDGYLVYEVNYSSSMLMNGLKDCDTSFYSYADVDKKTMWLDCLDEFGGRILADGLENFNDLFMDPITVEVCGVYKLPTTYTDILIYANNLLADNKYNRHVDITGNRYRTNEVVAGYVYKALSRSYAEYRTMNKRGKRVGMSMKRSGVIDAVLADPMSSDLSILSPLLEIEAANTVSFKGLSGMNSDRAYGLDKRTYDSSMINKLALSTGFASNVGISRQSTIDMDIKGERGYIKDNKTTDDMGITKTFSMTEAVTPFGTTRDDPFRSAMTFIQTSKHSMRTERSSPLLITNGADEALAHMVSDNFAYKAKKDGKIIEVTPEKLVLEYKDGTYDYVNLKEEVKKNSDGGFYITVKLDSDLKEGKSIKAGDIVAFDSKSFSNSSGATDNIAYNLGVLAKVAIINSDEGFEDSTIVSDWLSEALASEVIVMQDIMLPKDTNILNMVSSGQAIQEGEPLIVFQNSFDEEDANMLLKSITDEDLVSDLGRIKKKSKVTGIVQDIKVYRTCEESECSDSAKKLLKAWDKTIKDRKAVYKKYSIPGANKLDADYKLPQTGKLKNIQDGILVEFYLKYYDKFSVGDKNVAQSAAKGVAKDIFPKGQEPWSEYRPEEPIHGMYSVGSFNARMITSVIVSGAINKAMIELDRHVKETMGLPIKYLEDIK